MGMMFDTRFDTRFAAGFAARWSALALATVLLAGCATPPVAVPPPLAPPAALLLQGVPPVPQSMADAVARYTEFAGHAFVDWHPTRREMLVSHRPLGGNIAQLYRVAGPLAEPEPLTGGNEPVTRAWYEPREGRSIVLMRGSGGNEVYQLYRLDLPGREQTLLTDPDQRHSLDSWLHRSSQAIVSSVPLDRTAAGGRRTSVNTTLWLLDPARPGQRRVLAELPGGGWQATAVSPDDRQAALRHYVSATESQIWLLDLATGTRRQLLPAAAGTTAGTAAGTAAGTTASAAAQAPASHGAEAFSPDGRTLYLVSDRAGEFREVMALDLASGALRRLNAGVPRDVDDADLSADGTLLALRVNVDGRDELQLVDARSGSARPAITLPAGSVGRLRFHAQAPALALQLAGARSPGQVYSLDTTTGRVEPWTRPRLHPALDAAALTEQQIVRWTSFDGRSISGLLNRPPARFTGRRPVLINIHGGPEAQAKIGFGGRNNHLLQDLGIAVLQPNVRGSSGYGKTFLGLDNGALREDAVKDIAALLDWIATQPDLDPQRVVVAGGSYGGYMSLAVATTYPERIAGSIDVVGISNFVSFLENTESYRRDLRRVEYGDERDPVMRAVLQRMSPLTHAARIARPLMVVQGKNDPRVPVTEAEQIVAQVRGNGTAVWYLRADNEGHGFARKENADYQFYATVLFLRQVLGLGD
jgi:dipeptidyl aminopeptidase/acylaminoacyl peptidase